MSASVAGSRPAARSVEEIRRDFPILSTLMNGAPLAYLDNAASTQKPLAVIDRMNRFYREEYANVHRGVYRLSHDATAECDRVRGLCRKFLNAASEREIIFVRGATEAINLVASSYAADHGKPGQAIVITEVEHHANLVPWQALCQARGLTLRVIPVDDRGVLRMEKAAELIGADTLLVAIGHVSNVLGTVHDVRALARLAHAQGAVLLADGAQAAPHMAVDVRALDCDFYCFSGHKMYGPTGVGVLYGKAALLEGMRPYQFGGDMIESVTLQKTTYARPPQRFEAGTPPFVEIVGLGAALEYLDRIGLDWIETRERELLNLATERLSAIPGLRIYGQAEGKASLVSFTMGDIHPHDIGTVLDEMGVAVRAGHHCAQPTMERFRVPAMARASFSFYNTADEIGRLSDGLLRVHKIFS